MKFQQTIVIIETCLIDRLTQIKLVKVIIQNKKDKIFILHIII